MMTLLALSLCIGLLIDDAIVVRENIVRHAEMGKDHVTAALDGTKKLGWPYWPPHSRLWPCFYLWHLWAVLSGVSFINLA